MPIANMPLFTFLSGFLFEHIYNKSEKYKDKTIFFRNKAKRLLLPFLVFGTLISLSSPEFHLYQMLYGAGSHMWYCTMLFWGFVIAWLLKKIDNTILTLFIVIISAVVIIVIGEDVPKMPFGFHKAIFYFYYFYLGQLLCKYNSVILKYRGYIIGFCLLLVANQFWLKFNTFRSYSVYNCIYNINVLYC